MSEIAKMRMNAYYYGFSPTGSRPIDRILSAVACAGKAYHHTECWQDESPAYGEHVGDTPIDWIQNAANDAASDIRKATLLEAAEAANAEGEKLEHLADAEPGHGNECAAIGAYRVKDELLRMAEGEVDDDLS